MPPYTRPSKTGGPLRLPPRGTTPRAPCPSTRSTRDAPGRPGAPRRGPQLSAEARAWLQHPARPQRTAVGAGRSRGKQYWGQVFEQIAPSPSSRIPCPCPMPCGRIRPRPTTKVFFSFAGRVLAGSAPVSGDCTSVRRSSGQPHCSGAVRPKFSVFSFLKKIYNRKETSFYRRKGKGAQASFLVSLSSSRSGSVAAWRHGGNN